MKTYLTTLPNFEGFYNLDFDNIAENLEISEDSMDYKKTLESISSKMLDAYYNNDWVVFFDRRIKYSHLDSPISYNYRTDHIYCEIEISTQKIKELSKYIFKDFREDFKKFLNEKFTPRYGFIPLIANDIKEFEEHFKISLENDIGDYNQYLDTIIKFMQIQEKGDITVSVEEIEYLEDIEIIQ